MKKIGTNIKNELIKINKKGYLTINSQPSQNGIPSNSDNGWGPNEGFLYQKAYVEFFTNLENLEKILNKIEEKKYISYCAINFFDNIITNCNDKSNTLTWGVFSNSKIIQPTIANLKSFKIWKKDAFKLWLTEWACIYDDEISRKIIKDIHDSYYLVFVIDNNYKQNNIWELFD